QGGLRPDAPKNYVDVSRVPNGAIFEGTKGSILADFTSRVIIPNNDDGDLTYYKRRDGDGLLPLIGGTGQVTQAPPRRAPAAAQGSRPLPAGFTSMPSAEVGPNGFPTVQLMEGNVPAALALPNTNVESILQAEKSGRAQSVGDSLFQMDWIDACKGKSNSV